MFGMMQNITERKRAEESSRHAREQAEATADRIARLQQITAAITATTTPAQLAEIVLHQGTRATRAAAGILVELLGNGQEIKTIAALGYPSAAIRSEPVPLSAPTPMSDCIRTRHAVWIRSHQDFAVQYPSLAEFRRSIGNEATAALPLIVGDRVLGGLAFSFVESREFDNDEREFFLTVAQQCAQGLERARSEEALRASEARLRLATEAAGIFAWELDLKTQTYTVADNFVEVLGFSPASLPKTVPQVLQALSSEEDAQVFFESLNAAVKNRTDLHNLQYRIANPETGQVVWLEVNAKSVYDQDGNPERMLGVAQNITDSKQTEAYVLYLNNELKARLDEMNTLMDILPIGVWIGNHDCSEITGNPAAYQMMGLTAGSNVSITNTDSDMPPGVRIFVDGEEVSPENAPMQQVARTGKPFHNFEHEVLFADGTRKGIYGSVVPLFNEQGVVRKVIGTYMDFTERKQMEAALQQSDERFAKFMQYLPGLAWIKDVEGRYVYANESAAKAFRTPREKLYGKTDQEIFPPEVADQFQKNDQQALMNRISVQVIETLEQDDGVLHYSLVNKFPIPSLDGSITLIGGTAFDITERKQAEEALRQLTLELEQRVLLRTAELRSTNEHLLEEIEHRITVEEALRASDETTRLILDTSPDVIVITNKQGRIMRVNAQIKSLFGYEPNEVLGKQIEAFIPQRFHERHIQHRSHYNSYPHRRPMGLGMELSGQRKDSTEFSVDVMLTPIQNQNIVDWDTMVTIRDSRERKRMEAELRESQKRLQMLSQRLVEVQEEERRAIARELHDRVGQSLAALSLNLTIISNQLLNQVNKQVDTRLSDSIQLVKEVIVLVRDVMANLRPPVLDDYGLEVALQTNLQELKSRYGINVSFEKPHNPIPRLNPSIEMTILRITQEALLNIVRHAQADQATLSLQVEGQIISLIIRDNGNGIKSWQEANRPGSHGLMIMRERAEAVGGNLRISSPPGKGTQIQVDIPFQPRSSKEQHQ